MKASLKYVLAVLGGVAVLGFVSPILMTYAKTGTEPKVAVERGKLPADEQRTIDVFESNSASVVYITTIDRVLNPWTRNVSEIPSGTGTGFVWDKAGHIVTNYHVVKGKRRAKVRLSDQKTLDAEVVGSSPAHDLAVLRLVDKESLPKPVTIGRSSDLKVGQKVLAIGNPFGLDHTLTSGIVSALERDIDSEGGTLQNLIQTDAAINPGNSGGPLLDSAGNVIGVNVAIYSPSGGSAGIGFAIPVDVVNRVVPQLVKHGRYVRPILGITMDARVNKKLTEQFGVKGVLVLKVSRNTPAARAGIRPTQITYNDDIILGDIIQAIDGKPVKNTGDLSSLLDEYKLNDEIELKIYREKEGVVNVSVKLDLVRRR